MRLYDRDGGAGQATIRLAERERPQVAHHSTHLSREAEETRVDLHTEYDTKKLLNGTSLDAPPPRNGYVQRWIVDGSKEDADTSVQRNWRSKMRMGWQIRDPETIPVELRNLFPSAKLGDGAIAIRVASSVLCELPRTVAMQRLQAVDDLIKRQSKAIPESTQELRKRGHAGAGELEIGDQRSTFRGRRLPNAV